MVELTKTMQLINTGPAQDFNLAQGCCLSIYARYTEQDIANNRTYYIAELYLYVPQYYYIGSYANNNVKKLSATGLSGFNVYTGSADYYAQSLGTTEGWVTHEDNGEKTVNISGSIHFPPWGKTLTVSASATLPKIPRVSDISVENTSYNIGEEITIKTDKKSELFTDRISFSFGENVDTEQYTRYLAEGVTGTTLWNTLEDAEELYKKIPNSNKGVAQLIVETFSGDTLIGSKSINIDLNVVNSNPEFANFTYEDTNPKTLGVTGDNQIIVKGYSNVKGTVSVANKAVAINSATMKKYRFVIGEKQKEFSYSESLEVSATIDQADSNSLVMYAIDSRNNSTSKSLVPEIYLNYKKPTILDFDVYRTLNGVGEAVNLKIRGEFWNNHFGVEQNELAITFRFRNTKTEEWTDGASSITPNTDGNSYSFEGQIAGDLENAGFNLENSYEIEVTISDKLDSSSTTDTVGSGTPNMAMHKNGTAFGSVYDESVGGIIQANKQQIAVKEEEFLKVFANYSLDDGERLLTRKGEVYSTEEVRTNKIFIGEDGTKKSIYRKMKIFTVSTQSNTHQEFDLGIEITNTIFSMGINVLGTGALFDFAWFDKSLIDMYSFKGSTNWMLSFKPNSADFVNATLYAVMEYIKPQEFYDITNTEVYNLEAIIKDGDFDEPTEDLTEEQIDNELNTIIGGEYGNS